MPLPGTWGPLVDTCRRRWAEDPQGLLEDDMQDPRHPHRAQLLVHPSLSRDLAPATPGAPAAPESQSRKARGRPLKP